MSLPSAYINEITNLNREILKSQPTDILQFCANFFQRRLESQRAEFLLSQSHSIPSVTRSTGVENMAQSTFPGLAGASSNPFGAVGGPLASKSPGLRDTLGVSEEEENDNVESPTTPNF